MGSASGASRSPAKPRAPMADVPARLDARPVILFDGVCNLCNGAVNFVIDHDPAGHFRFGALQSEGGSALLHAHGLGAAYLDSLVLVESGRVHTKSDAALRIARGLGAPWALAYYAFVAVPKPLRDAVYNVVAANRYRWFGRQESCRMPTPELRARFV